MSQNKVVAPPRFFSPNAHLDDSLNHLIFNKSFGALKFAAIFEDLNSEVVARR